MEAEGIRESAYASQSDALCGIRSLGQWRSWAHSEQQPSGAGAAAANCSTSASSARDQAASHRAASPNSAQHQRQDGALHYQMPTRVQPKAPLEECPHASEEGISAAFSPVNCAGIRSLPNALRPGFREVMYAQIIGLGRAALQQLRATSSTGPAKGPSRRQPAPPHGLHGSSLAAGARGAERRQRRRLPAAGESLGRFSSNHGFFSMFRHLTSEYERRERAATAARLEHRAQQGQVSASDFVVRSCPLGLRSVPAFGGFSYDSRPYVEIDHLGRDRSEQLVNSPKFGAFVPGGGRSASPAAALKSQAGELLAQLSRQIGRDFPASFLQVFQDSRGAIVVSFSRQAAAAEDDITTYMNQLAKAGQVALQFRLCKDPSRWGVVEDESDTAFYALWPPWSPHRAKLPDSLLQLPPSQPRAEEEDADPVLRRSAAEGRGMGVGLGIRGLL